MSELDLDAIKALERAHTCGCIVDPRDECCCDADGRVVAVCRELRRLREENAESKKHGILDVMRERDEARAEAFRANRRADEFMAELRAIAAHVKCAQRVDAVTGAFDALAKRVEELESWIIWCSKASFPLGALSDKAGEIIATRRAGRAS